MGGADIISWPPKSTKHKPKNVELKAGTTVDPMSGTSSHGASVDLKVGDTTASVDTQGNVGAALKMGQHTLGVSADATGSVSAEFQVADGVPLSRELDPTGGAKSCEDRLQHEPDEHWWQNNCVCTTKI